MTFLVSCLCHRFRPRQPESTPNGNATTAMTESRPNSKQKKQPTGVKRKPPESQGPKPGEKDPNVVDQDDCCLPYWCCVMSPF